LNVWVLEPGENEPVDQWDFGGTFVFLVEELGQAGVESTDVVYGLAPLLSVAS